MIPLRSRHAPRILTTERFTCLYRRRIVEDSDDEMLDLSKVIFAERDRETGLTSYRDVELTPYGNIEEWPRGFFDQAAEEERAIILGGLKKRRERAARSE